MNISKLHQDKFPSVIKARGSCYFAEDRVQIIEDEPYSLRALVSGSGKSKYFVDFLIDEENERNFLIVDCDCPYSEGGDLCKHIWATMVKVDTTKTIFSTGKEEYGLVHSNRADPWDGSYGTYVEEEDDDEVSDDEEYNEDEDDEEEDDDMEIDPNQGTLDLEYDSKNSTYTTKRSASSDWQNRLNFVAKHANKNLTPTNENSSEKKSQIIYVLDSQATAQMESLAILLFYREQKKNGHWGVLRKLRPNQHKTFHRSKDPLDLDIASFISQIYDFSIMTQASNLYQLHKMRSDSANMITIDIPQLQEIILSKLSKTDRFFLKDPKTNDIDACFKKPISSEFEKNWNFKIKIHKDTKKKAFIISGHLFSDEKERPLDSALIIFGSIIIFSDNVARFDGKEFLPWLQVLSSKNSMEVPLTQQDDLVNHLFSLPLLPEMELPKELNWEKINSVPKPGFNIQLNTKNNKSGNLFGNLFLIYNNTIFRPDENNKNYIVDRDNKKLILRSEKDEQIFISFLKNLGMQHLTDLNCLEFPSQDLQSIVSSMVESGWDVQAEGKNLKKSGVVSGKVSTGIDWFELSAEVDFEGYIVSFPTLLEAVKNRKNVIKLGDGTYGILAQEWLEKYGHMLELAEKKGKKLKFKKSQISILDALLENKPEIKADQQLSNIRNGFKKLRGIKAEKQPKQFNGELRKYQQEGLGWLKFLNKFQFGGCLADDMGLGKTIQIIALLVWHYTSNKGKNSSLVVVPRSLIYNWKLEANKFSKLKVLDYSKGDRHKSWESINDFHIILTTYSILRSDIEDFTNYTFDYAILDEAQAIKNQSSQVAQASKLINAKHKLAMSGTPVENHIGDLWSLFEFINPGIIGPSNYEKISKTAESEEAAVALLSRAISPFILRRTKIQVLKDLPSKSEQIIHCELNNLQQKKYNELKRYFRVNIGTKVKEKGLKKSQMHILEALLRLRQTACHHGLVDPKHEKKHSSKTEVVLEKINEIIEMGSKVIVFSQFTKMLSILKYFLDKENITYEYLDGATRNRQERVDRFQTDGQCPVFLISLKAGGVGLNLTAAEYCMILDPWWNPAVEAQAVDRIHRIGQKKKVFAYRFIAKGTIEEKIMQLQADKKSLSEGLITSNSSLLKSLTQQDLDFLLA